MTTIIASNGTNRFSQIVVAGSSPYEVAEKMGSSRVYRIGRIRPKNAFAIDFLGGYLLYAHRLYTGHRRVWEKAGCDIPDGHDIDHVLARNICKNIAAGYILLACIPLSVNRSHGQIEKEGSTHGGKIYLGKTFYMDRRIFQKLTGRVSSLKSPYTLGVKYSGGSSTHSSNLLTKALGLAEFSSKNFKNYYSI